MILNPYAFAAAGYDSDAQAFFTAAGISDTGQKDAINTLVLGLKSNSIWTKMRAIYPFVGGTAGAHAVNLRNPGTYDLTFAGGITHSATGAGWNGSSGYANTGLNPSSVLTQDSEHYAYYSRSTSTANGYDMGAAHLSGQWQWSGLGTWATTMNAYMNNGNSATATVTVSIANGSGLWVGSRTASNALSLYRNGSSLGSNTDTNIWVKANNNVYIGATNVGGSASTFSGRETAFASIGDGLTSTDVGNLYSLVQAYQTALGRQV